MLKLKDFRQEEKTKDKIEIVNLEFALRAYNKNDEEKEEDENQYSENSNYNNDNNLGLDRTNKVNEAYKLNPKIRAVITNKSSYEGRKFVAGDIFQDYYKLNDVNSSRMTERQKIEKSYYDLCSICNRNSYQISLEGCDCNN